MGKCNCRHWVFVIDVRQKRLSQTAHLEFRKRRAGPLRKRLKAWLDKEQSRHPPKSPLGAAIRYTLGQWNELGVFLDDARVPLDNNASERSLRRIASYGSLCTSSSSTWNHKVAIASRKATRTSTTLTAAA